jgi:hypothetical protein
MGRPGKLNLHQHGEALARIKVGESLVAVARTYGVDPTTRARGLGGFLRFHARPSRRGREILHLSLP